MQTGADKHTAQRTLLGLLGAALMAYGASGRGGFLSDHLRAGVGVVGSVLVIGALTGQLSRDAAS